MVEVRAAGAVVIRTTDGRVAEVLAVHRPRYDDWSLPKGKLDDDETYEEAAVREVLEETGMLIELGRPLHETTYTDRHGRAKVVRWWTATVLEQRDWTPDDEIDDVAWIPIAEVRDRLTYPADHALVDAAMHDHRRTTVLVVRHAHAGDRDRWRRPDHLRPLSDRGHAQARGLLETLSAWRIDRVLTSPYVRCVQTVEPLAEKLGLAIEHDDRLAEGAAPQAAQSLLLDAGADVTVWCTHGDVMADLVLRLRDEGLVDDIRWDKGCTWVLECDPRGNVTAARYLEPPS